MKSLFERHARENGKIYLFINDKLHHFHCFVAYYNGKLMLSPLVYANSLYLLDATE